MNADTELVLNRIEAAEASVHRRIDDVVDRVDKLNGSAQAALIDAAAARIVADAATLKVGQVHTAQKDLDKAFTEAKASAAAVSKHAGPSIRLREFMLVVGTASAVVGLMKLLHLMVP